MKSDQKVIDGFCLLIDKLNCSARIAIKNQFKLDTESWNLYYFGHRVGNRNVYYGKNIWRISDAVERSQIGSLARRVHPLAFMLNNRFTITCDRISDIGRIVGIERDVISIFLTGLRHRSEVNNYLKSLETLDKQNNTQAFTISWQLALFCMNAMFSQQNATTLPYVLVEAAIKAFNNFPRQV